MSVTKTKSFHGHKLTVHNCPLMLNCSLFPLLHSEFISNIVVPICYLNTKTWGNRFKAEKHSTYPLSDLENKMWIEGSLLILVNQQSHKVQKGLLNCWHVVLLFYNMTQRVSVTLFHSNTSNTVFSPSFAAASNMCLLCLLGVLRWKIIYPWRKASEAVSHQCSTKHTLHNYTDF